MSRKILLAGVVLLLAGLACDFGVGGLGGGSPTLAPVSPGECDTRATAIQSGVSYSGSLAATQDPYPANCTYYCAWIPSGASSLEINLTDFSVDLDLFAGFGSFEAVYGADPADSDWVSNEFGTSDEQITINNPDASGAYYIEICSYEGEASNFTLEVTAR